MAHRRHSPARKKKTRNSWLAMGALLGALPSTAAAQDHGNLVTHAAGDGPSGHSAAEQGAPLFRFAISPGPLESALRQFESITGFAIRVAPDLVGNLTTDGATGSLTALQSISD